MIKVYRTAASLTVIAGFLLLMKILFQASRGTLDVSHVTVELGLLSALILSLPVPFHVMSVGLVLQRKWLTGLWNRIATWAVTLSGIWLGAALAVKLFVI